jgi:hypothetical protein
MYDMRFAVGNAVPASAGAQPVIDRALSVMMPLVILPPVALEAERNATPEADAAVVAALAPQPAAKPEPSVAIDIPFPEPATVDLSLPSQPKAELPAVAALAPAFAPRTAFDLPIPEPAPVDLTFAPPAAPQEKPPVAAVPPQAEPQAPAPARTFDIPLPDPAAVDLTLPPAKTETDIDATEQKRSETDARSNPIEVAVLATDVPAGTVKLPTKSIPLPRPKGAVQTAAVQTLQAKSEAKPQAKPQAPSQAKAKPRRKVARTTQRSDFDSLFGFPAGKPQ